MRTKRMTSLLSFIGVAAMFVLAAVLATIENFNSSYETVARRRLGWEPQYKSYAPNATPKPQSDVTCAGLREGTTCGVDGEPCRCFRPQDFLLTIAPHLSSFVYQATYDKFCRVENPFLFNVRTVAQCANGEKCASMGLRSAFTIKDMRKAATNTVGRSLEELQRQGVLSGVRHLYVGEMGSSPEVINAGRELLDRIELGQNAEGYSHPIVANLRNPVRRFISACKYTYRTATYPGGDQLSFSEKIDGCLENVIEEGWYSMETMPMIADLFCGTLGRDITYSVYKYENDTGFLLSSLGMDPDRMENSAPEAEPGGGALQDVSDSQLDRICSHYVLDVRMMESLGYAVPECEGRLP